MPIEVVGCGVRTGNLFDWNWLVNGYHLSPQTGLPVSYPSRIASLQPVKISANRAYLSFTAIGNENVKAIYSVLTDDDTLIRRVTSVSSGDYLDLSGGSKLYIAFYSSSAQITTITTANVSNIMLSLGSEALPYEPYGYKLNISNGGENLFDKSTVKNGYYIDDANGNMKYSAGYVGVVSSSEYIYIGGASNVYIGDQPSRRWGAFYDSEKAFVSGFNGYEDKVVPINAAYVRITVNNDNLDTMMLNLGSTAKPYAPYNRITTPIYLGQCESTRRIKKLVFDGTEAWVANKTVVQPNIIMYMQVPDVLANTEPICTHYIGSNVSTWAGLGVDEITISIFSGGAHRLAINAGTTALADFKSYLASQYAAGTPVTVWYVLVEPETTVVNEPLMKIGDYADTVSFAQASVTIPTINGANVLDMASPIKPSEVYVKGKGIKPTGYGQLTDVNGVNILDKDGRPIYVHGQ